MTLTTTTQPKFAIGDKVFFNYVQGVECTVIAYVLYSSHVEYIVFSELGTQQMVADQLTENKVIV